MCVHVCVHVCVSVCVPYSCVQVHVCMYVYVCLCVYIVIACTCVPVNPHDRSILTGIDITISIPLTVERSHDW